jgi:hypothetical protein
LFLEFLDFDKMKIKERVNGDEIDKRIEALLKSQEEFRKSFGKGLEELRKEQRKTDEEITRLIENQRQTDKTLKEEQRKTNEQLKKLGKHIGDLTNGWGKFVVGLTEPGIERCLKEIGYSLYGTTSPPPRRIKNKEYEIDLLCPSALNGKNVLIVIEAKSYLNQQKVKDFIEKLKRFHEFFPEYGKIEVIGGVAGIRLASGIKTLVLKEGIYLFSVSHEVMKSLTPPGFKPKIW